MKNIILIFLLLLCGFVNAQKSFINISLNDTDEQNKLSKFIEYENLCNKINFVEKNVTEFASINSKHKNLNEIIEDISVKSNHDIEIILAYGKHFTSLEERKEKLIKDITEIRQNYKCCIYETKKELK
jgi:uncharacterized protein YdcH (DUF465 family)